MVVVVVVEVDSLIVRYVGSIGIRRNSSNSNGNSNHSRSFGGSVKYEVVMKSQSGKNLEVCPAPMDWHLMHANRPHSPGHTFWNRTRPSFH